MLVSCTCCCNANTLSQICRVGSSTAGLGCPILSPRLQQANEQVLGQGVPLSALQFWVAQLYEIDKQHVLMVKAIYVVGHLTAVCKCVTAVC